MPVMCGARGDRFGVTVGGEAYPYIMMIRFALKKKIDDESDLTAESKSGPQWGLLGAGLSFLH
jgi:hypothetical protein